MVVATHELSEVDRMKVIAWMLRGAPPGAALPPPAPPSPPAPPAPPPYAAINWDFEDGTLQGWRALETCATKYLDGILTPSYANMPTTTDRTWKYGTQRVTSVNPTPAELAALGYSGSMSIGDQSKGILESPPFVFCPHQPTVISFQLGGGGFCGAPIDPEVDWLMCNSNLVNFQLEVKQPSGKWAFKEKACAYYDHDPRDKSWTIDDEAGNWGGPRIRLSCRGLGMEQHLMCASSARVCTLRLHRPAATAPGATTVASSAARASAVAAPTFTTALTATIASSAVATTVAAAATTATITAAVATTVATAAIAPTLRRPLLRRHRSRPRPRGSTLVHGLRTQQMHSPTSRTATR